MNNFLDHKFINIYADTVKISPVVTWLQQYNLTYVNIKASKIKNNVHYLNARILRTYTPSVMKM